MTDITAGMGLIEDTEEQEQGGGGGIYSLHADPEVRGFFILRGE